MPYTRLYIHLVFATKRRYPFLDAQTKKVLFNHIRENARQRDIFIASINGYEDHVHLLIRLHPSQNIAWVTKIIKGESGNWANKNMLFNKKFAWASEYYAASVDGEDVIRLRNYIFSQEARHYAPLNKYLDDLVHPTQ